MLNTSSLHLMLTFSRLEKKPLYSDKDFTVQVETYDALCSSLGSGRFLCNIVSTSAYGSTSLSGIYEEDDTEGFGTYVITGATDYGVGSMGKVTGEYTADLITYTICGQAPVSPES